MRYTISIETNEASDTYMTESDKIKALKTAKNIRRGWCGCIYVYRQCESPNVTVYDNEMQERIFCKPVYKKYIKP
jgi:hypothetical protein